jgi:hypothetical protein
MRIRHELAVALETVVHALEVKDAPRVREMNGHDPQIRGGAEVDKPVRWDPRDVDAT